MSSESRLKRCCVVTVHGTFARHWVARKIRRRPDWWPADSAFCQTLCSTLPHCTIVPFEWSGANSHEGRIAAGEELARRLMQLKQERPGDPICIIAHSHGGNVALKAIDVADPGTVSSLFLLGMPHMSLVSSQPTVCDKAIEGTQHPCGGAARHWLFWGDAARRVHHGIWNIYSDRDAVQIAFAQMFTGVPLVKRLRWPGAIKVTRALPAVAAVSQILVDMHARERTGALGRWLGLDRVREHNALPSGKVAAMIGQIITDLDNNVQSA